MSKLHFMDNGVTAAYWYGDVTEVSAS